jgi:hypothetical protein
VVVIHIVCVLCWFESFQRMSHASTGPVHAVGDIPAVLVCHLIFRAHTIGASQNLQLGRMLSRAPKSCGATFFLHATFNLQLQEINVAAAGWKLHQTKKLRGSCMAHFFDIDRIVVTTTISTLSSLRNKTMDDSSNTPSNMNILATVASAASSSSGISPLTNSSNSSSSNNNSSSIEKTASTIDISSNHQSAVKFYKSIKLHYKSIFIEFCVTSLYCPLSQMWFKGSSQFLTIRVMGTSQKGPQLPISYPQPPWIW